MAKLVIELQKDALDKNIPVEDLLRKALAVSVKIGISEIESWLNSELNGYKPNEKIPEYRRVEGIIKAFNPYHGWIPVMFEDDNFRRKASTQANNQSIGEISKLAKHENLRANVSSDLKMAICKQNGITFEIEMFISSASLIGILESVRNSVLKWALDLEKNGILGEDMTFSDSEKERAKDSSYTVINNIGVMHNSQLQQLSDNSSQELRIESLDEIVENTRKLLAEGALSDDQKVELETEISTIELQKKSPKPKR